MKIAKSVPFPLPAKRKFSFLNFPAVHVKNLKLKIVDTVPYKKQMKNPLALQVKRSIVGRPPKYPFSKMKKGDSFFVNGKSITYGTAGAIRCYWNRILKNKKFAVRLENKGYRFWRIK